MQRKQRNMFSAPGRVHQLVTGVRWYRAYHFTRTSGSFFGHICSRASASSLSCESKSDLMERWTEDLRIVCPEMSDEGVNLRENSEGQKK